jgi:hypothetical protein
MGQQLDAALVFDRNEESRHLEELSTHLLSSPLLSTVQRLWKRIKMVKSEIKCIRKAITLVMELMEHHLVRMFDFS